MKKILSVAAVAAIALMSSAAQASTDGQLSDSTSTGTLALNVRVVPMVSIRGLDDVNMTIDAATLTSNFGHTDARSQFCVFSNADADGAYKVSVNTTTPGTAGDYANPYGLVGGSSGTQLDYTVGYYDSASYSSTAATFMRPGTQHAMMNTRGGQSRATDLDCSNTGGQNASLNVGIRNAVALAALADTYTGTLSVVVSVP